MFISKLNRLFEKHGRTIMTLITGIIIVTFVLYFSPGFDFFGLLAYKQNPEEAGSIAGLSKEELGNQISYSLLVDSLKFPYISLNNEQFRQFAAPRAMQDAILLREAAKRGISVDDKAVAEFEKDSPSFQKEGKFDKNEYEKFVRDRLAPFNMTKEDIDNAVRQHLTVKRLEEIIKSSAIVTPGETKDAYQAAKEKIKLKLFRFDKKDFIGEVKDDPASVESFFNASRDNYKIAPKVRAHIFRFNYIGYEEKATKSLKEEEINAYYEKNKNAKYKDGKDFLPLEKVRDKIIKDLAERKSKELALDDAQVFGNAGYDAFDKLSDPAKTLEFLKEKATAESVVNVETDWFGVDESVIPKVGEEPELAKDMEKLYHDFPVSETVKGNKAAFVAVLLERKDERPAEFAEVKAQVEKDYKDEKAAQIAREKARAAALEVSKGLSEGKETAKLFEVFKPEDIKEFKADSRASAGPESQAATSLALNTVKGAVSEVTDTASGAVFIFVENRELPSDEDFNKDEKSFSEMYKKQKENAVWDAFISDLLKALIDSEKNSKKEDGGKGK